MTINVTMRQQIMDTVERLVRERIAPRAAEIDALNEFPSDLYKAAAELGVFGVLIPEAYGGIGPDLVTPILITERIARASPSFSLSFTNCGEAAAPIVLAGSEVVKRRWLPGIARGEIIPAFCLTEPDGGSDAAGITTRAVRDGDHYVITGRKMWITNGSIADVYTIFAKTDPAAGHKGMSAFVMPRGQPGFSIGRDEKLLGLHGSPTTELVFEGVRVPVENRLGEEGGGFKIAMETLDVARLNCSAMAVGAATGAIEQAIAYARQRLQFGKPIIEHQGLQFLIAEMVTDLAAGRALWKEAIRKLERGHTRDASVHAGMAKLLTSDMAMRVTTNAVQILGANGLSRNYSVERFMRDVKAFQIFDGTNQIQKMVIGRYCQKEGLPFEEILDL